MKSINNQWSFNNHSIPEVVIQGKIPRDKFKKVNLILSGLCMTKKEMMNHCVDDFINKHQSTINQILGEFK